MFTLITEKNMRVMLIDDDEKILKSIGESLDLNGIKNKRFSSPKEALLAYVTDKFDAVILDLKMPEMNGIEVLKAIKEHNSKAFVIILTGYPELESTITALNLGTYALLKKPSSFREIMNVLAKIESERDKNINERTI